MCVILPPLKVTISSTSVSVLGCMSVFMHASMLVCGYISTVVLTHVECVYLK